MSVSALRTGHSLKCEKPFNKLLKGIYFNFNHIIKVLTIEQTLIIMITLIDKRTTVINTTPMGT
jgi:hypothetical protein